MKNKTSENGGNAKSSLINLDEPSIYACNFTANSFTLFIYSFIVHVKLTWIQNKTALMLA